MATYTIFDGDNDKWAFARMKGWSALPNVPFTFDNAHDLDSMTSRAQGEDYVKRHLRQRMLNSNSVVVLIGVSTRNLYRFVRWELSLALSLELPIIGVNLNGSKMQDEFCPPIIRDKCVVHVPFKLAPIKHALTYWPSEYHAMEIEQKSEGARHYTDSHYRDWEI